MKTIILTVAATLMLSLGVANAEPAAEASPGQAGSQYNVTAGAAGWG